MEDIVSRVRSQLPRYRREPWLGRPLWRAGPPRPTWRGFATHWLGNSLKATECQMGPHRYSQRNSFFMFFNVLAPISLPVLLLVYIVESVNRNLNSCWRFCLTSSLAYEPLNNLIAQAALFSVKPAVR